MLFILVSLKFRFTENGQPIHQNYSSKIAQAILLSRDELNTMTNLTKPNQASSLDSKIVRAIFNEYAQVLFFGESAQNSFSVNRNFSEMGMLSLFLRLRSL